MLAQQAHHQLTMLQYHVCRGQYASCQEAFPQHLYCALLPFSILQLFCNPQVLRRGITVEKDENDEVVDVREETTVIDWHDGRNLLVREVGGGGKKVRVRAAHG